MQIISTHYKLWIVAILLFITQSNCSYAQNVYFLPGDAFFPTVATFTEVSEMADSVTLKYHKPPSQPALWGQAVGLPMVNVKLSNNIKSNILSCMKKMGDDEYLLLIYPREFINSIEKHPLFLKCNEKWMKNSHLSTFPDKPYRIYEYLPSKVIDSWRASNDVPELPIENIISKEAGRITVYGNTAIMQHQGDVACEWGVAICLKTEFDAYSNNPDYSTLNVACATEDYVKKGIVKGVVFRAEN